MKLVDLEPQFLNHEIKIESWIQRATDGTDVPVTGPRTYHNYVDSLADAQGLMMLCPACFEKNQGPVGTHRVLCWFAGRGVPDDALPTPGRWQVSGNDFSNLTLAPSVQLIGGCSWHGFVTGGNVTTC